MGPRLSLSNNGLGAFLAFSGLPPGAVFWAKVFVLSGLLEGGISLVCLVFLALSEFISWGVYLSILIPRLREGK